MRVLAIFSLLFLALAAAASVDARMSSADDISGKWTLAVAAPGETVDVVLDLKQDGEKITGTLSSPHGSGTVKSGSFKDKKLAATIAADFQGSPIELQVDGTVDGEKITGSLTAPGLGAFSYSGAKNKK